MDLGASWQENKRFVVSVGAGAVLFLIAHSIENSIYEPEKRSTQREIQRYRNQLEDAPYTSQDQALAEEDHEALLASASQLAEAVRFRPRPEFVPDPAAGSAANHYLRTLSRVRDELTTRAGRANLELDSSLGMPELSPTSEAEIVRYLEALDLVETVSDLAIRARIKRIDRIQVRLDPLFGSRQGVGDVERTRVLMSLSGTSLSLTRLLAWTQRPGPSGRVLAVDELEMLPARNRRSEVRLDLTLSVPRVRPIEAPGPE